ncbi:MAG: oligosaccharide flippase family protein [Alistipes sp.]|nr:oligosaccharide flippase family protein [Alistipes senegalensis]MCM1249568.1 oligosaccharide flippase family protein [Alistipes sp.]
MIGFYLQHGKEIVKKNATLFKNFSYISVLQLFVLAAPLITYPYLIRTLGAELYGWVILAQIVASYCSLIVDFGFNAVSAKHIAINRNNHEKLSEIMSSILTIRFLLWICCLFLYVAIVYAATTYREHFWLFVFSFGLTLNELLFPQFYFQGIEKMRYITILNIAIRSVSIVLIFLCIKSADNYLLVPVLMSAGYLVGGFWSLCIIFGHDRIVYKIPSFGVLKYYFKDASLIFLTNIVCTIKDKLNYILLGHFITMNQMVVYDLGSKITTLLSKPSEILSTVLLPKIAKEKNVRVFKIVVGGLFVLVCISVGLLNIFLPEIVRFFFEEEIELFPLRLYSLAPVFLGVSVFIASNLMIAFGYNKYLLYSIFVTTGIYLALLGIVYFNGWLTSVVSFVVITLLSYLGELFYRIMIACKIIKKENRSLAGC